jgi:hypothetical protein
VTIKEIEQLETKGGAIQALTVHNITNINGKELIAGKTVGTADSEGRRRGRKRFYIL